jgi:HK97 family phage portal protein
VSLFRNRALSFPSAGSMVAERTGRRLIRKTVSRNEAMHHSAVWACLRLRADLISTMPLDVYRRINGVQVEQAKPPVLIVPGGKRVDWIEWCYSTQLDLDSVGNTVGIITARDGLGLPAVIELADIDEVTFVGKGSKLTKIRVGKDVYDPEQIWHEKQFTKAGCPIGLSPIAHAAMSIRGYLSAQEFAAEWFDNSTVPGGHLKNTAKTLNRKQALKAKASFKAAVSSGDVWVSGNDWEYNMLAAKASESAFLEEKQFSVADVCRFLGVPADMIDATTGGSSITYANITQRNLQLLIMNLGPALTRRESAISRGLLPQPRYVKFNRGALLEMDLKSRYEAHGLAIEKRFLAPSEVREHENLPPFTDEQITEFAVLFPNKASTPAPPQGSTT